MRKKCSSFALSRKWLIWHRWWTDFKDFFGCAGCERPRNGSGVARMNRSSEHDPLGRGCSLGLSLERLKWTIVFVMALGGASGRAQTNPITPPTTTWTPVEGNSWFTPGNWTSTRVPAATDDVGIGLGGPAQILGDPTATAHTVTLGVLTEGVYAAGELDVAGGVLVITPTVG